jgi:Rhodopirellula transposase DDE domain
VKFRTIWPHLDERTRRLTAASEAKSLGRGGVSLVSRACGLSRKAIHKGIREIEAGITWSGRIRRPGGGRKPITQSDPQLVHRLEAMIDETTRGDPESPLRWTCKSTRALAAALTRRQHPVSHTKVAQILNHLGYSLQGNRKTEEGEDHPDREAQFGHISNAVKQYLRQGSPVISVDTKKKELIGNYYNGGQQWHPAKTPRQVRGHDFPQPDVPRAYPYGIYDIGRNPGFVNVGTDHDTGAFAVASIRGWWRKEGKQLYANAARLLITADAGGSNGWRLRLWKVELQKFADQSGLTVSVCHFPPATSKWNKIEHRLFSFISLNWRAKPLTSLEVVLELISATTTETGLTVTAVKDGNTYPTGIKVSDEELAGLNLLRDSFHGDWNYTIQPQTFPVQVQVI